MPKIFSFIIFVVILFTFVRSVIAVLTINEIYPAPGTGDYEWVELYNNDDTSVDLTQYILIDLANNRIKINEATLSPSSYLIASCSSVLNNNGDTVFLKKVNGEIIEIATYSGIFTSDKSYAKCPDGNGSWLTTNIITKNFSNQTACLSPTPTPEPTNIPIPTSIPASLPISPSPTPISYNNVYLSEVYPYPATGENEWLELYNDNDFSVELNNWYFDDVENGGSSPKSFSLTIDQKSYVVFDLSSSMFNNDGDSVRLLDFNKNLKDSFEYTEGEKSKSWGRTDFQSDQYCLQEPTKNSVNGSCLNQTVAVSPTSKLTPILLPTSKTTGSTPLLNLSKKQSKPINQSATVLGINTETPTVSTNKPLLTSLTLISFFNSLLTIFSVLLKIKIHEGI